jgi:hypothetical protein
LSRESTLSQLTVFLVRIPPHPTDEHRRASHVRHHTSPSVSCTDHMLLSRDRACAASLEDSQELQPSSGRERSCRSKSVDGRLSSVDGFSRLSLHTWATEAPEHGLHVTNFFLTFSATSSKRCNRVYRFISSDEGIGLPIIANE